MSRDGFTYYSELIYRIIVDYLGRYLQLHCFIISNKFKEIWRVSIQISLLYLSRLYALASMHSFDAATGILALR